MFENSWVDNPFLREARVYDTGWGPWEGLDVERKAARDAYQDAFEKAYDRDYGNQAEQDMVDDEIASSSSDPDEVKAAERRLKDSRDAYNKAHEAGLKAAEKFDTALKRKWIALHGKDFAAYVRKRLATVTKNNGGKKPTMKQIKATIGID